MPCPHDACQHGDDPTPIRREHDRSALHGRADAPRLWERWLVRNVWVAGLLALAWLVFRTGTKPSRVTYPCQQAALSAANLAFGAVFVAGILAARRSASAWFRSPVALAGLFLAVGLFLAMEAYRSGAADTSGTADSPGAVASAGPAFAPVPDYRAQLWHVDQCPQPPAGDRFLGLDNLLMVLGQDGVKLHESAIESPFSGPAGIIGADDVVLIKINYQWAERGGTNVDLLRGLVRRIVEHPEGFTGEIVICENAQFASTSGFDRTQNNAENITLSPHDVVTEFRALGVTISQFDWTNIRYNSVTEYDQGNTSDGYVLDAYDPVLNGRPSYPKFRSADGTYVSLRFGIWDPDTQTYSRERLRFLNLPVLKSHHAVYGATASVKHYMGVVTREQSTNSHNAIRNGILGAVVGDIGLADLNIIDAIWINANPTTGPGTTYEGATRRDELVASLDPVALDIWAVKNILVAGFLDNGFTPPWPSPSADPDDPASAFRVYLDSSMNQMRAAGLVVTNDPAAIDVTHARGDRGDFDADGDSDLADHAAFAACFTGEGGGPLDPACAPADFDRDDDVDCSDYEYLVALWTEPGAPPDLPECDTSDLPGNGDAGEGAGLGTRWLGARPHPVGMGTTLSYRLAAPGHVTLQVFDIAGRSVRTVVDAVESSGEHAVVWDRRDDAGNPVARGSYSWLLVAPDTRVSGKLVVN